VERALPEPKPPKMAASTWVGSSSKAVMVTLTLLMLLFWGQANDDGACNFCHQRVSSRRRGREERSDALLQFAWRPAIDEAIRSKKPAQSPLPTVRDSTFRFKSKADPSPNDGKCSNSQSVLNCGQQPVQKPIRMQHKSRMLTVYDVVDSLVQ